MSYIAKVDKSACSAHGDCADVAPHIFAVGEIATVVGSGSDEELLAAAEACPALAIMLTDASTGEVVYP